MKVNKAIQSRSLPLSMRGPEMLAYLRKKEKQEEELLLRSLLTKEELIELEIQKRDPFRSLRKQVK
jgi:hypothetical protein